MILEDKTWKMFDTNLETKRRQERPNELNTSLKYCVRFFFKRSITQSLITFNLSCFYINKFSLNNEVNGKSLLWENGTNNKAVFIYYWGVEHVTGWVNKPMMFWRDNKARLAVDSWGLLLIGQGKYLAFSAEQRVVQIKRTRRRRLSALLLCQSGRVCRSRRGCKHRTPPSRAGAGQGEHPLVLTPTHRNTLQNNK